MERQLSRVIMGEGKPKVRKLKAGATLTTQGEEADAIYLLLDGVIQVVVDGEDIAALGPGALIGERAVLEGGRRTATLTAVSPCRVAEARKVELDLAKLAEISEGHRREAAPRP
jgi:CRP-like cAMP-binding protein